MRTFVRNVVLAACLAGMSGLMAQTQPTRPKTQEKTPQVEISRQDEFMQRKQGQYTAETEARLREARENSASRAEPQTGYQPEPYTDTWLRVKQGVVRSK